MSDVIQIKQLTHYAGPLGNHAPESVWACPRVEALALIEGRYAVQVESAGTVETTAAESEGETTAASGGEETTAKAPAAETAEKKGFLKKK